MWPPHVLGTYVQAVLFFSSMKQMCAASLVWLFGGDLGSLLGVGPGTWLTVVLTVFRFSRIRARINGGNFGNWVGAKAMAEN